MIIMGALLFPNTAYAAENAAPPSVSASITGTTLRIEAIDGFYAVEAIFINEKRFNYRVDGVLNVDARDYAGDSERFSVYAIDYAGNRSNVVWLDNPNYTAPHVSSAPAVPRETAQQPEPSAAPPRQANPFTPDGQASVLDQADGADGKEFFTFTTPDGNVFHLIIDHQRNSNNIYFLNAVTEADLIALAEKTGTTISTSTSAIPTPQPAPPGNDAPDEPETVPEPETPPPPVKQNNNGTLIFVVIGVLAVGGAGYYLKIVKPKQKAKDSEDDEDNEVEDDSYADEMEYEDEQSEDDDDSDEQGDEDE